MKAKVRPKASLPGDYKKSQSATSGGPVPPACVTESRTASAIARVLAKGALRDKRPWAGKPALQHVEAARDLLTRARSVMLEVLALQPYLPRRGELMKRNLKPFIDAATGVEAELSEFLADLRLELRVMRALERRVKA